MEKDFRRTQAELIQLDAKLLQETLSQYRETWYLSGCLIFTPKYQELIRCKKMAGLSHKRVFSYATFEIYPKSIKAIEKLMNESSNIKYRTCQIRGNCKALNSQKKLFPALNKFLLKVANQINLSRLSINQKQLKRVLSAVRGISEVDFDDCTIALSSTPDFTKCLPSTKIQELRFIHCGSIAKRGWKEHPEQFEYLMGGLSTSGLKNSLQTFTILRSYLTKEYLMRVVSKYEFDLVKFTGDIYISPSDNDTCGLFSQDDDY
ncbi:unnamed protein product [Moneuplotes crassus]|uniref:Uncharacterized protein n=1 Tax=Euplotes crassus TaxID=5936 RepID=A0AAD1XTZ8_EUPCR|nr:unnamed protein product [Moneuplotes crassus]